MRRGRGFEERDRNGKKKEDSRYNPHRYQFLIMNVVKPKPKPNQTKQPNQPTKKVFRWGNSLLYCKNIKSIVAQDHLA